VAILESKHLLAAMKDGKRIDGDAFAHAATQASDPRNMPESGPWLKPFLAPFQRSSIEGLGSPDASDVTLKQFEDAADQARKRLLDAAPVASVSRSELEAALSEASALLADPAAAGATARQRSNMRQGLQMFGVHIAGDTDSDTSTTLRLANADLPFSLRFIACSFAMPLSLSSAGLVTLDLSGCAVKGIDATFLRLSGSLRLRRLYSSAPLDFTGARIHGFLDGADMVLQPFGPHPAAQAVSPERAMLGLNQVQIDNEIRLQRAQIWGGITMRGLEAKRSLYMSDAVVLCPLAVLEALAKGATSLSNNASSAEIYELPGVHQEHLDPEGKAKKRSREQSETWLNATFSRGWSKEYSDARKGFDPRSDRWTKSTLHALLTSNLRARTSAIRGDGIKIEGSIFMERVCSHGRLRMKYAQIAGGLTLAGARLRSTEALMPTFDQLSFVSKRRRALHRIKGYRLDTYKMLVDPEDAADTGKLARGADIYALDLRESRIEGDVRIGVTEADVPDEAGWNTRIDGVVALDQANFGGALRLERVIFSWSLRLLKRGDGEVLENEGHYRRFYREAQKALHKELWTNKKHQLTARGLTTADNVSLCGSRSLKGADFSNAVLGGSLLFWAKWEHPREVEDDEKSAKIRGQLRLDAPAADLGGAAIDLSATAIAGDVFLLFDPEKYCGPWLTAERVQVGGLLSIMPPPGPDNIVVVEAGRHRDLINVAIKEGQKQENWATLKTEGWASKMSAWKRTMPGIDLANGTATLIELPSVAWPRAGRLLISGFTYQRALPQGPLGPHRLATEHTLSDKMKERDRFWNETSIGFFVLAGLMFAFALLTEQKSVLSLLSIVWLAVPCLALGVYICWLREFRWVGLLLGKFKWAPFWLVAFMTGLALFILFWFEVSPKSFLWLTFLFLIAGCYISIPRVVRPKSVNIRPMAIEWLEMQPPEVNAYRTRYSLRSWLRDPGGCWKGTAPDALGNLFRSLEPYSIAADALRREGRWISANLVEQERFRVRNWQLSWRTHFLQKSSFKFADWMTEYGYNYARMLFATALVVILAGMTVEKAEDCGAIAPKVQKVNLRPLLAARPDPDSILCPRVKGPASAVAEERNLDVMLFAADTVLPIADLGEVADWEVSRQTTALDPRLPDWLRKHVTYARLLAVYHIIGILLAGVLLLGLSTRFGQWLSRYGD
jgi:hypothetical protein